MTACDYCGARCASGQDRCRDCLEAIDDDATDAELTQLIESQVESMPESDEEGYGQRRTPGFYRGKKIDRRHNGLPMVRA